MKQKIADIEARLDRDEDTISRNYQYLCTLIGDLSEELTQKIRQVYIDMEAADNVILQRLNQYITTNDERITNLEQNLLQRITDIQNALNTYITANDNRVTIIEEDITHIQQDIIDLSGTKFDDAKYNSSTRRIEFYADGAVVKSIDATPFIKDGMVQDVRIQNGNLVIDFNTDSGIQDISIPLTDIFNPDNYYTKQECNQNFVTELDTNGNNVRWKKNGTWNSLSVPYAEKASKDANGDVINTTYLKKTDGITNATVTNTTMTFTRGDGSIFSVTLPTTDVSGITQDLTDLIQRISVLESMWEITNSGTSLTAKSNRAVISNSTITGAKFYDSTISAS